MKCVSYTRTLPWKNHQGELAIAEQNQRIAAYLAEHKELDLLKKYSDRKNDEKARTAFDQMTDDGVEQKFDCIIVASMYYCGPDFPAARQAIKETLYATGIDLIVLDEGLDTSTASRKEVEDYFEAKRCEMHAEIMFAWRRKQGAGFRLTSSVPFGYIRRNGESNMIKDEEVAPYLSEAFSRYASGQKMRDIAKWLNEQGVEPPMRHKKRILGKPYDAEPDQWTTDMLRCPKPDLYGCGGKWKPPDHCGKLPRTIHNQRTVSCVPVQYARGRKQNLHSKKLQKAESAGKAHCLHLWTRTLLAQG